MNTSNPLIHRQEAGPRQRGGTSCPAIQISQEPRNVAVAASTHSLSHTHTQTHLQTDYQASETQTRRISVVHF